MSGRQPPSREELMSVLDEYTLTPSQYEQLQRNLQNLEDPPNLNDERVATVTELREAPTAFGAEGPITGYRIETTNEAVITAIDNVLQRQPQQPRRAEPSQSELLDIGI